MATIQSLRSLVARGATASKAKPRFVARVLSTRPQLHHWENDISHHDDAGSSFYEPDLTSFRSYPVQSSQFKFPNNKKKLSLEGFLQKLPETLTMRQEKLEKDPSALDGKEDPVLSLFRYVLFPVHVMSIVIMSYKDFFSLLVVCLFRAEN